MFAEGLRILIAALHLRRPRRPVVFPSDGNNLIWTAVIILSALPIEFAAGASRPVAFPLT